MYVQVLRVSEELKKMGEINMISSDASYGMLTTSQAQIICAIRDMGTQRAGALGWYAFGPKSRRKEVNPRMYCQEAYRVLKTLVRAGLVRASQNSKIVVWRLTAAGVRLCKANLK